MADYGTNYTDSRQKLIENRLKKIYTDAKKDVEKRLKEHLAHFKAKDKLMQKQLAAGEITQEKYSDWVKGQVFIGERWKEKRDAIASTLYNSNVVANGIVNGQKKAVFAENANYQAYMLEKGLGASISFTLYDSATVTRLLKDRPELIKRRVVNGVADRAWNKTLISDTIAKGIITGMSIDKIADEIANKTATSNEAATVRYARTAMTSAQNAGRISAMNDAIAMGIKVKKKWLATLDERTRDSHAVLDGQVKDVNEPFDSPLGKIMFPGDPSAAPANVWNCRCTLINEYEDYKNTGFGERRDNQSGDLIADMSYAEWKATKAAGVFNEFNEAKKNFYHWQQLAQQNDADHVFKGIWKDDVTYADFSAKEASIPAKREYFLRKIDELEKAGKTAEADVFRERLKELELFEREGVNNAAILDFREMYRKDAEDILKKAMKDSQPVSAGAFGADAYSKARKDAALWAKTEREADKVLRPRTGEVWRAASRSERDAIYEYTRSYSKFNEPLRGQEYYGSYVGVGKTDLNANRANNGNRLNAMTDIINKCSYDTDVWLQRGCHFDGMERFFQCDASLLRSGSQKELEDKLLGKEVTEYGFMSCGTKKGTGFSRNPIILNVYAPSGTKMMYVEPISAFGDGDGLSWDGLSSQRGFGSEFETILQQGTKFQISKVEKSGGTIYVDLDVIDQSTQQRWKP